MDRITETAEVIGAEFKDYAEYKQEFDRIIHKTSEGFVETGYMLRIAEDTSLIREAGYKNMEEFAKAEYGIDKGQASRFINICRTFSEGGYSRVLRTEYSGMGVAKLGIMLTLPMSVNEELTPGFSKEDIRLIKEEVDEEKKVTELEIMMEGEKETQTGIPTLLGKALHQLGEDEPGLFLLLFDMAKEYAWQGESAGILRSMAEVLAPAGEAVYSVRVQGTGRLMFSFNNGSENFRLIHVRQDEKESHNLLEILDILGQLCSGYAGRDGKEAWKAVYGREFPGTAEEKTAGKEDRKAAAEGKKVKKTRVVKAKTENGEEMTEQEDVRIPGQLSVEDYPSILPAGYENKKVAPVQPEKSMDPMEDTGRQTEQDSTCPHPGNAVPAENSGKTVEEQSPENGRQAAGLEGMSLPDPVWVRARETSREEAVSEIRQLAIDIADTVIENAFYVDIMKMRRLESAKEEAGRLQELVGGLLEMIKKEAYQE